MRLASIYTTEREREIDEIKWKSCTENGYLNISKKENRKKETEYKTLYAIPPLISGSNYVTVTMYLRQKN